MIVPSRRKKMLRKALVLSIACFSPLVLFKTGYCVPALPSTCQLEQPDGIIFDARQWGDEKVHGWETADGYTIEKDPATNYWFYTREQTGGVQLQSAAMVGDENAPVGLSKHIRLSTDAIPRNYSSSAGATQSGGNVMLQSIPAHRSSVSGTRPIPVMMVNFSDTSTTYDPADFQSVLFGTGTNSMKDYYEEVSYGVFSVSPGSAGVKGWYTAAKTHAYYGDNNVSGYDKHPAELVIETVTAADATVDFSQYDSDGDCYVDAVVIIHQGSGEEASGPATDIWSHQWDLASAAYFGDGSGVYTTNDHAACGDIKIKDYVIQPEKLYSGIQTVGVFVHEYGHVLGLPDLYDVDYSSKGIGYWGLMSSGAWGYVSRLGDRPVHMTAWSKYMLGWVDPVTVTTRLADETIDPSATHADVYRFFPDNQAGSQEYYLIENRQRIGFDAGLRGAGLAIWHIDEGMASLNNLDNSQECAAPSDCSNTHYRVSLVQADGEWDLELNYNSGDSGDLFPGSTGNTGFGLMSDPASDLFDGSSSHVDVTDIIQDGTTITASLGLAYSLVPSATSGGAIAPGVSTIIDYGNDVTFTITPNAGYQISNVSIDGVSMGAQAEYTFSDTRLDHTISASFTASGSSGSGGGGSGGGCFIGSL
jgi:immune inhibitor A